MPGLPLARDPTQIQVSHREADELVSNIPDVPE